MKTPELQIPCHKSSMLVVGPMKTTNHPRKLLFLGFDQRAPCQFDGIGTVMLERAQVLELKEQLERALKEME